VLQRGHDVGWRRLSIRKGQRGQLDAHHQRVAGRGAAQGGRHAESGCAAGASQVGERHAAAGGGQPQALEQNRFEGGHGIPGGRYADDRADRVCIDCRGLQGSARDGVAELGGVLDVGAIARFQGLQPAQLGQREHGVAGLAAARIDELQNAARAARRQQGRQRRLRFRRGEAMFGNRCRDAQDFNHLPSPF
jgi:hypothetical protein